MKLGTPNIRIRYKPRPIALIFLEFEDLFCKTFDDIYKEINVSIRYNLFKKLR